MSSVWAGENNNFIKTFKKNNPPLFVIAVMGTSNFLLSLFGGVMAFLFGITFPMFWVQQRGTAVSVSVSADQEDEDDSRRSSVDVKDPVSPAVETSSSTGEDGQGV
ncbi:hypothetical protein DPEC_G00255520 [Dallia pectoralis]|uniref:Uncharacterized protein n=1 Tax=Dallia pectoralis TaxID=75939 RepID=A0ACC2FUV4_DALPE|nr:hypothetical protein DPEC_G00255520 [Dallia pectoralis]